MNNRLMRNEYEDLINNINVKDLQKQLKEKIEVREFKTNLMENMYLLTQGVQELSNEVEKTKRNLDYNNKINSDENLENKIIEVYKSIMNMSELLNIDVEEKSKIQDN